jgi:hypothetical protein
MHGTHRELAGGGDVDLRVGPRGSEQHGELARGDKDETGQYELPVPVADPSELALDAAVLLQHLGDVSALAEHPREPRHAQDLQVADDPEQHAHHEEHGGAVHPRRDLERARRSGPPRRERPVRAVPRGLVRRVGEEAGQHEACEEAERPGQLDDAPRADVLRVVAEVVQVEQAAHERGERDVGERAEQRQRRLHLRVVRAAARQEGQRRRGDGHGEEREHEPRGRRAGGGVGVVDDAHPTEAGPEAAELVARV